MDIVMVCRDRKELTEQTVRTLILNAADWSRHRLLVVVDYSDDAWAWTYDIECGLRRSGIENMYRIHAVERQLGVGGAKNFGAAYIQRQLELFNKLDPSVRLEHAENSLLMFSDNDMYYLPGWDEAFERTLRWATLGSQITQLGGWRHPYHGMQPPLSTVVTDAGVEHQAHEVDAATGNCFVMRWSDWLRYGPFDANAIGPGQSEDYALSQRIRAGGGLVATLDPPVAIHCGLVNSVGEPATGWRECEEQITGQLAGLSTEMRDSVLIMRPVVGADQAIRDLETRRQLLASREVLAEQLQSATPDPAKLRQMGFERAKAVQLNQTHMTEIGTWDFGDPHVRIPYGGLGADPGVLSSDLGMSAWLAQQAVEQAKTKLDMQPRDPLVPKRVPDGIIPRREITIDEAREMYPSFGGLYVGPDAVLPDGRTVAAAGFRSGPVVASQYAPGSSEQTARYIRNAPLIEQTFSKFLGVEDTRPVGVNVGSGQRRFTSTREVRWINCDVQDVPPDRVADIVCDVGVEKLPLGDSSVQYVVLHQVAEHFGCGESEPMLRECWRVLARGGSLIVTVPDMRKLAARWLGGEMDDQLFMTSVYGAYMGDEADRHKWGFSAGSLFVYVHGVLPDDAEPRVFDWRNIPGADIARDWWVAAAEFVKR